MKCAESTRASHSYQINKRAQMVEIVCVYTNIFICVCERECVCILFDIQYNHYARSSYGLKIYISKYMYTWGISRLSIQNDWKYRLVLWPICQPVSRGLMFQSVLCWKVHSISSNCARSQNNGYKNFHIDIRAIVFDEKYISRYLSHGQKEIETERMWEKKN